MVLQDREPPAGDVKIEAVYTHFSHNGFIVGVSLVVCLGIGGVGVDEFTKAPSGRKAPFMASEPGRVMNTSVSAKICMSEVRPSKRV